MMLHLSVLGQLERRWLALQADMGDRMQSLKLACMRSATTSPVDRPLRGCVSGLNTREAAAAQEPYTGRELLKLATLSSRKL